MNSLRFGVIVVVMQGVQISFAHLHSRLPRFSDYPVHKIFTGKPAPLQKQFITDMDKTMVVYYAPHRADFAGHYKIAVGDCGTDCRSISVIDSQTGKVYFLGHSFSDHMTAPMHSWSGPFAQYRLRSRLLILHGQRDEKEGDEGAFYYVFENGRFRLLRSVPYRIQEWTN